MRPHVTVHDRVVRTCRRRRRPRLQFRPARKVRPSAGPTAARRARRDVLVFRPRSTLMDFLPPASSEKAVRHRRPPQRRPRQDLILRCRGTVVMTTDGNSGRPHRQGHRFVAPRAATRPGQRGAGVCARRHRLRPARRAGRGEGPRPRTGRWPTSAWWASVRGKSSLVPHCRRPSRRSATTRSPRFSRTWAGQRRSRVLHHRRCSA